MTAPQSSASSASPTTLANPHPANAPPPLWKLFLVFLGPMIVSNILQALSGTVNSVFIGQMLGTHALAAVSGMFPIVFFFISLIIGVGSGASVLIGQAWGAKEPEKVKAVAGAALWLGLLIGVIAAALGGVFTREALTVLGTPASVLDDATGYARILMLALPLILTFLLFTQLLRGIGDTVTPLVTLSLSTATGLLLTPALIQGWLGLPPMGVRSAAIAGVISNSVAITFLAFYLRRKASVLALDGTMLKHLRFNPALLKAVLKIGLPTGLSMVVISVSELVILGLVNHYGANATAAYGAVNQIINYVQFPALSIAITASILGAQSIGAGKADRLPQILKTGLLLNLVITGSLIVLGYLLSRWLLGLFITQSEVLEMAQHLLHIMLWSMLVFGFQAVVGGIMRASGVVMVPVLISMFCILGVELPAAIVLSGRYGLDGVWMAYPLTFVVMLTLQTTFYQLVWKHKKIARLV